jgi:hypothetical protein
MHIWIIKEKWKKKCSLKKKNGPSEDNTFELSSPQWEGNAQTTIWVEGMLSGKNSKCEWSELEIKSNDFRALFMKREADRTDKVSPFGSL